MIEDSATTWLLLVVSLPTQGATARMRIWRALKANGCAALRDGAYLLPASAEREQVLQDLADDCRREGGSAWLMAVQPRSADEAQAYRALFDRSPDYADLRSAAQPLALSARQMRIRAVAPWVGSDTTSSSQVVAVSSIM